jgi:hypothetical protein
LIIVMAVAETPPEPRRTDTIRLDTLLVIAIMDQFRGISTSEPRG